MNYLSLHNNYHKSKGLKQHLFIISLAVGQESRHSSGGSSTAESSEGCNHGVCWG